MESFTLAAGIVADRSPEFTLTVIIAGMGIVLSVLIVLILVFYGFGKLVSKSQTEKKKKEVKKVEERMANDMANSSVAAPAPVVESGISGEIVAAITAAVCAAEGTQTAKICTIKKQAVRQNPIGVRNPWAQAAVNDNTRPF